MITVTVVGTEALVTKLLGLPSEIRTLAVAGLAQTAFETAYREADKHTKESALIRSLQMNPFSDGWEIGHDLQVAAHAPFVHWGTREHPIAPRNKKVLRWPSGDGFVFAKYVERHPGYEGDPWLVTAMDEAERAIDSIIAKLQRSL